MLRVPRSLPHLVQLTCTLLTLLVDAARFLRLGLRSPAALAAENLFLRKQPALYQARHVTPRRATDATRLALVWLGRWFDWRQALAVVQPATFLRGSAIHVMLTKRSRGTVDQNAYAWHGGQQQTMIIREVCPQCKSARYKKNGHIHNGKQHHHCRDCGRQFVQCCEPYLLSEDKRGLIERVLVERIALRGMCRAVGVTLKWPLGCLVQCGEALPDHLHVQPLTGHGKVMRRRLEVEAEEMASFVQKKVHKQWIWIAMDATSRQVIAVHVGDRSSRSAKRLWAKIPEAYWQHVTFYTDQYVVYEGVILAAQHRAISKLARKTNHIERFNNTRRQRVSRLVREALSFSKKLAHHIGAIKLFICHYNLTRAVA